MKIDPQKLKAMLKQGPSGLVATSHHFLRRFDPDVTHDSTEVETYDASVLQQGRFWMRTVTWTCLLYTSPSPRDQRGTRMPSSA